MSSKKSIASIMDRFPSAAQNTSLSVNEREGGTQPMTLAPRSPGLAGTLGNIDIGVVAKFGLKRQARRAMRRGYGEVAEKNAELETKLEIERLVANFKLAEEAARLESNRMYAVLAEQCAAGEIQAMRRFEAVHQAGRELLTGDRFSVINTLSDSFERGELTEEECREEVQFYIDRYLRLKQELTALIDERHSAVKNAFRSNRQ